MHDVFPPPWNDAVKATKADKSRQVIDFTYNPPLERPMSGDSPCPPDGMGPRAGTSLGAMVESIQRLSPDPVSLKQLAHRLGMSTKHLQRLLAGREGVAEGTRERAEHILRQWLNALGAPEAPATSPPAPPATLAAPAEPSAHSRRGGRAVVLLGLVVTAGVAWSVSHVLRAPTPDLVVHAPFRIDTHEAEVFGRLQAPDGDARVVFYVSPEDGTNTYYRTCPAAERLSHDSFQGLVRFGNELGRDNEKLPLYFNVYGVLVPAVREATLPGTCHQPSQRFASVSAFREAAAAGGALAVSPPARTLRIPRAPRLQVELHSPAAGARLFSPVRCTWSPPLVLSIEVWTQAALVEAASGHDKRSGEELVLAPGRYEIKLRERRASTIVASTFFDVVPAERP